MTKTLASLLVALSAPAFADVPAPSAYTPDQNAQEAPAAEPPTIQPAFAQPIAAAPTQEVDESIGRAQFSGKRLAAEIAGGELVSLVVSFATYNALCNGHDCLGSALAAYAVDFAVTPAAIWAGGRALGGHGSLGWTYLGASTSLAAFSAQGSPDETPDAALTRINVEMAVSALLMPVTAALLNELSSSLWSKNQAALAVHPTVDRGHMTGAVGTLTVAF